MLQSSPAPRRHGRNGLIALIAPCALYAALALLFNLHGHAQVWDNCEQDLHFRNAYWLAHGRPLLDPTRPPLYYFLSAAAAPLCDNTFRGGQLVSALSAAAFLLLSTLLCQRLLGRRAAIGAIALSAVNAAIFEYACSNCTDMLFAALAAGALLAAHPKQPESAPRGRSFGAGCLAGLATAVRFQGYVLLAALLVIELTRPRTGSTERLKRCAALLEGWAMLFLPVALSSAWLGEVQPADALGLTSLVANLGNSSGVAVGALLSGYALSFLKLVQATDYLVLFGLAWLFVAGKQTGIEQPSRRVLLAVVLITFIGLGWFRGAAWDLKRSFLLLLPLLFGLFVHAADSALQGTAQRIKSLAQPLVAGLLLSALIVGLLVYNARQFLTWVESMPAPVQSAFVEFDAQQRRPFAQDGLLLTNVPSYLIAAGNGFHSNACCFDQTQFRYWIALLVKPNPVRAIFIELGERPAPSLDWQTADDYFRIRSVPVQPGFAGYLVSYTSYPDDALTRLTDQGIGAPAETPIKR